MLKRLLIRNAESERLLESFLIAAIASLLGIRLFLKASGYPTLGAGGIHIAHMLWGGLLMLAAIIIMLAFLGRRAKHLAAVIGGVGFGAFIDELGKFITRDNNYFFQPTIAIIYVTFIVLYMLIQFLSKPQKLSDEEYVINALEMTAEAVHHDLDTREKGKALSMLRNADSENRMVKSMKSMLMKIDSIPPPEPSILTKSLTKTRSLYRTLIKRKWSAASITWFFAAITLASLWNSAGAFEKLRTTLIAGAIAAIAIVHLARNHHGIARAKRTAYFAVIGASSVLFANSLPSMTMPALTIMEWGEMLSSTAAGAFVLAGIWNVKSSRLKAYVMFRYSLLVSIFLTQFFAFYREQLGAVVGLLLSIIVLVAIEYMIEEETQAKNINSSS